MQEYAEKFYKGKAWQNTRKAYWQSKKGICEKCLQEGLIVAGDIVHHIKPITKRNINNTDITLNWDNLQVLCRRCHEKVHRRITKRYTVDEYGHVTSTGIEYTLPYARHRQKR